MIDHPNPPSAHNKSRGRPAYRTDPAAIKSTRRVLMVMRPLIHARSSVSGRELTTRGLAYALWALDHYTTWNLGQRTPPPLDDPRELDRVRQDAARVVRDTLRDRARRDGDQAECKRLTVARDTLPLSRWLPPGRRLDRIAIAEEVASRYTRSGPQGAAVRAAERHLERLVEEATTWEYVHLGNAIDTGRRPLPKAA